MPLRAGCNDGSCGECWRCYETMREEFNRAADERDALRKEIDGDHYSSDPAQGGLKFQLALSRKLCKKALKIAAILAGFYLQNKTSLDVPDSVDEALREEIEGLKGYGVKID